MRDMLSKFSKEVVIEYVCQNLRLRLSRNMERELLYIAWDRQAIAAQKAMDDSIKRIDSAKTWEEYMAAQKEFDLANMEYKKADRLYAKMEKLDKR